MGGVGGRAGGGLVEVLVELLVGLERLSLREGGSRGEGLTRVGVDDDEGLA